MTSFAKTIYEYVRSRRWVLLASLLVIVLSLYLHLKAAPSPLQSDDETWLKSFNLHKNTYPFSIRYFQTYSTIIVSEITGLSLKNAFYTVQYFLMLLLSLIFFEYLKKLQFREHWSLAGAILLLLSFPILAAHFEPVHTWDDFWMYGFPILFLVSLLNQNWIMSALFFTLGCFAREQMVLFYPFYLVQAWRSRKEIGSVKTVSSLLLPLIFYGAFYLATYQPADPKRWSLFSVNFADGLHTADATVSIWNVFGFLWLPALFGLIKSWNLRYDPIRGFYIWGLIITVPLTVAFGCLFTLVRETRILFPPFVFIIPLAVIGIKDIWETVRIKRPVILWILTSILLALLIPLGLWFSRLAWPNFDYNAGSNFRRDFAGVNLGLALVYLSFLIFPRKARE